MERKYCRIITKRKSIRGSKQSIKSPFGYDDTVPPVPYWFTYATLYSIWYCMPETGDYVNTYFPSHNEAEGIVINSIKQTPSEGFARQRAATAQSSTGEQTEGAANKPVDFEIMAGDEKVKMLVTGQGKMVVLDGRSGVVTILCNNGTYITLSDGAGISIITSNDVTINAMQNIAMTAKEKVFIQAETEVKLEAGASNITLDTATIKEKATDIYLND